MAPDEKAKKAEVPPSFIGEGDAGGGEEESLSIQFVRKMKVEMRFSGNIKDLHTFGEMGSAAIRNPYSRELLFYMAFVAIFTFGATYC